ncbi:hypothetical protein NQ318_016158 [Aromia moschata]|uniref:Uncharacterized protein n=1 Tax=Aromia moschata TaxID=1265417 RepID=A0AAV8XZ55_9CUCU|nr:hypothetical protein NQ318_016158 [Aromia moschata]
MEMSTKEKGRAVNGNSRQKAVICLSGMPTPCSDKSKIMHHIFWPSRRKLNLNPKFVNNPSSLELPELGGSC